MAKRRELWVKVIYNADADRFELWDCIGTEDEADEPKNWNFIKSAKCLKYEGQTEGEPEMIHFSILKDLLTFYSHGAKYYGLFTLYK